MQRDMSYELDDSFSTRNAGELVRTVQTKTRVMRTPGLRVLAKPQIERANVYGSDFEQLYEGTPVRNATGLAADFVEAAPAAGAKARVVKMVNVPLIGPMDMKSLIIGGLIAAAVTGGLVKMLRR